ncbi:hypothetical protein [Actinoplanes awajinensis]|uniref:Uncharacterized protein n=1 Tax=Actinoplanes awajinensis subsp. mycoplanecinus TaxID=135947 RepID=A0A0X3UTV3_9ACTN|nr:hypothetical protein [Actinoplanes awajinensis]KUL35915.1 hypothetical protein ADL15_14290 [Actinoplanes awajinensis subsp. mycoplanecinus]
MTTISETSTPATTDSQTSAPTSAAPAQRRSYLPAKSTDRRPVTDPEATLREQLDDQRYLDMRTDMGLQYVDGLRIPSYGDMSVPGYRMVPVNVAREYGLAGLTEGEDPLEEIEIDEPTTEPVGAVDGNSVPTFVEGIRGQHLFDILNATLLAQLAANAKFDREQDPINWTRFYGKVLENVGFVVPEFSFFGLRSKDARFSMDQAVLKVIAAILTPTQVELAKASFDALQSLRSDDRRLQIFRRNSSDNRSGNFQISSVGESSAGIVSLKLNAFFFKTDEQVTDVLWFKFRSASTTLQATRTTLVLNDQVYDRLRQSILDKLGNRGLNFIGGLELSDV